MHKKRFPAVYAPGESPEEAQLVAALAVDAARVVALAGAFGGCEYLNDAQSRFIETWRRSPIAGSGFPDGRACTGTPGGHSNLD